MNIRAITETEKKNSKSPKKHTPQKLISTIPFNSSYDTPAIRQLMRFFRRQIEIPIQHQSALFNSKTPLRCILHNNPITLYCLYDKKPLCASCMYQTVTHKKHQVVPVNKANTQIQEELTTYLKIVESKMPLIGGLITKSKANYELAQEDLGLVINKVENFYIQISQFLLKKKNQQILTIQKTWNKIKYQYLNLSSELNKIHHYSLNRLKEIAERNSDEFLLFNRNVAINLSKLQKIITPSLCTYHDLKFPEEIKRIENVISYAKNNLNLNFSFSRNRNKRNTISSSLKKSNKSGSKLEQPKKKKVEQKGQLYQRRPVLPSPQPTSPNKSVTTNKNMREEWFKTFSQKEKSHKIISSSRKQTARSNSDQKYLLSSFQTERK